MTVTITPLSRIDAVFEQVPWDFSISHASVVRERWDGLVAEKPQLFNGQVLMQHRWTLEAGVYSTAYSAVDYASFLIWHHLDKPGSPRRNGFAMAALRSADGAFLLGVMGVHTANAGKVYFAAGTPDMKDVTADGRVDLANSMTRELFEETGLLPDEVTIQHDWVLVEESHRAAFLKPASVCYNAVEARQIILSRIANMDDQELADIAIVRSTGDINEAVVPLFAARYMQSVFASEQA